MESFFINAMALAYGAGGVGIMLYGCDWQRVGSKWSGFASPQLYFRNAGKQSASKKA